MATPKLFDIELPDGDVPGFDIDYQPNTGQRKYSSSLWLNGEFDGVRFIGHGVGKTHIRPAGWNGITCVVGRHNGIVQFENLTMWAGYSRALLFGLPSTEPPKPKFHLRMLGCEGLVPPPTAQGRTAWFAHTYQADVTYEDCRFDATQASEHAHYGHHFASKGMRWTRVRVDGSGGENCKTRSSANEGAWAGPKQSIVLEDCTFKNWYQDWSNRGGGAVVIQGGGANVLVQRCEFWAGPSSSKIPGHQRSRCIMITSESNSYDTLTGTVDKANGFGNGHVVVRQCALRGQPGPTYADGTRAYALMLRVGRQGGCTYAARSVTVDSCSSWGDHTNFQFDWIPAGQLRVLGCNTDALRTYAKTAGMDTTHETSLLTAARVIPLSEGLSR